MNAEELASRLRMLCQIHGLNIKCSRRVSLLHRDVNAANPGVIHTNVGYYVSTLVSHRDIHWLANFQGFLLCGADHAPGIFQLYCGHKTSPYNCINRLCGGPRYGNSSSRSPCGPTLSITFRFAYIEKKRSATSSVSVRPFADWEPRRTGC